MILLLLFSNTLNIHYGYAQDIINKTPITLTKKQQDLLSAVSQIYNKYPIIKSAFIQKDSSGHFATGWFIISKPNYLRIEYFNLPVRFILNHNVLLYQDLKMKTKSFLPINTTPLSILLNTKFSFQNNSIIITNFEERYDYFLITVLKKNNPEMGELTLFFDRKSKQLIKWRIFDIKHVTTEILLTTPQFTNQQNFDNDIFNTHHIESLRFDEIKVLTPATNVPEILKQDTMLSNINNMEP